MYDSFGERPNVLTWHFRRNDDRVKKLKQLVYVEVLDGNELSACNLVNNVNNNMRECALPAKKARRF